MLKRPTETIQAAVSTILGAVMIIYGATKGGFDFDSFGKPEVLGAIAILAGYVAPLVTWWQAKQQRAGKATSAPDGTVLH